MPTQITFGSQTFTPQNLDGYSSSRPSRNIVHEILGRSSPDVTLRPAGLRTGTLTFGFQGATSEADSLAFATAASMQGIATLITDRATAGMTFVVSGDVSRNLDDESRDAWLVELPYQEVSLA